MSVMWQLQMRLQSVLDTLQHHIPSLWSDD
jgi:hypothetical protein